MADHRLIAYLAGELDDAARLAVEADLARDLALREELEEWRLLAEADQQRHNADGLAERQGAFLRELDALADVAPTPATHPANDPLAAPSAETSPPRQGRAPDAVAAGPATRPAAAPSTNATQPPSLPERLRAAWRWLWPQSAGPMLPTGWALALVLLVVLMTPSADRPQVDPIVTRGGASCARWIVDLPDNVSVAQLRDVLTQYAVDVTSGPDADGRFVMSAVREDSLRGAANALGALSVVPVVDGPCVKVRP